MTGIVIDWLDACASTSSELAARPDAPAGLVVAARTQTAGRGQRGNSWEAEPGANLTFSQLLRPAAIGAVRQFELSMIVSLAIADTLDALLAEAGVAQRTAININQTRFVSDAPNPCSLRQFTGLSYNLEPLLQRFAEAIADALSAYETAPDPAALNVRYMSRLWRRSGIWTFATPDGTRFEAEIIAVDPDGILTLSPDRRFAFKEVAFLL